MLSINNLYSSKDKRIVLTVCHHITSEEFVNRYPARAGIISVISGMATIVFNDGKEYLLKAGDVFVCSPNEEYKLECKSMVEIYTTHFRVSDFISTDYLVYSKENTSKLIKLLDEIRSVMDANHVNSKKVIENVLFIDEKLEARMDNYSDSSEVVIKSAFVLIMSLIYQYFYEDMNFKSTEKDLHFKEIENTVNYITEHLSDKITLDELAKIAMMGKTNYSLAFKRTMGVTVWDYILNARVELATSYLLEQTENFNISEIALRCGFNNITHFNKVFKKAKGKTPSEFKKKPDNPCF